MDEDNLDKDEVRGREEQGDAGKQAPEGGSATDAMGKSESGGSSTWAYSGGGSKGGAFGKAKAMLKKHRKKVMIGGAFGGALVIPLIVITFFLAGALKIPNFVENVASWRLAKLSRSLSRSLSNVMGEDLAAASLSDQAWQKMRQRYGPLMDKIDRFNPNKQMRNLQENNRLVYNVKKAGTIAKLAGRGDRITSVTVAPTSDPTRRVTIDLPQSKGEKLVSLFKTGRISPLKSQNDIKTLTNAVNAALKVQDPQVGSLVRAAAIKSMFKARGVSLRGWLASQFVGKSDLDARVTAQQNSYKQIHDGEAAGAMSTDDSKKAAKDANDAESKCVADKSCITQSVQEDNGGMPKEVGKVYLKNFTDAKFASTLVSLSRAANKISSIYAVAVPICMIYDGSKISQKQVDATDASAQRSFAMVSAEGDHLKFGNGYQTPEANALNWKLGDVQSSNIMQTANGQKPDTTEGLGGQRTTFGDYADVSIIDVIIGQGSPLHSNMGDQDRKDLNTALDTLCPVVTSLWFAGAEAVTTIALSFFSGGGFGIVSKFFGHIGAHALEQATGKVAEKIAVKQAEKSVGKTIVGMSGKTVVKDVLKKGYKAKVKSILWKGVKTGTAIAGQAALIFLARWITSQYAGNFHSGLETDKSFADEVDNGGNQFANESERAQYYGRPMTNAETAVGHKEDLDFLHQQNQQKNFFDRYFALQNPQSLATRLGLSTMGLIHSSSFSSIFTSLGKIFNPAALGNKLFGSLNAQAAVAAGDLNIRDYGNVQFGYSHEEDQKMAEDSYASSAENALQLQEGLKSMGKSTSDLDSQYGPCFTDTVGKLLAEENIQRDPNTGDLIDTKDVLCSPTNLSFNNPDYGDLVFRWRLDHNYNNMQDYLGGLQDPAEPGGGGGAGGDLPNGDAKTLAAQIVANKNITWNDGGAAIKNIASTGHARDCGAPAVDPRILQVILALAKSYKFTINNIVDGHACDGLNHPKGKATDINHIESLDGKINTTLNDGKKDQQKKIQQDLAAILAKVDKKGKPHVGGLGQADCTGMPQKQQGAVNWFADACTHQHVDVGDY